MRPSVVILAGGEGRRIGGGKPLRLFGGRTLLARAIELARSWSDEVRVAARIGADLPVQPRFRIDDDPAIEGPLGGLAAALAFADRAGSEGVFTIPCDMPFLPGDLALRLAEGIGDSGAAIAASAGSVHPVCALWRTACIGRLHAYVAPGRRSLRGFAAHVGHVEIAWPAEPVDPFLNINTEADLEAAEALLEIRRG